jgi:hypothetical protein
MQLIDLAGFWPDVPPTTAGVVTACENFIPTAKGLRAAYGPTATGFDALAAACTGAAVLREVDDTKRVFAGTASKLYELAAPNWTDVSRATDYGGGTDDRWRFAVYGNVALAANGADELQFSNNAGDFADAPGAPIASFVAVAQNFVMLGNYDDGTAYADGWYCSTLSPGFTDVADRRRPSARTAA